MLSSTGYPRRQIACISLIAVLTASAAARTAQAVDPPPRPNVILMMCDDLGFSDLGCYGGEIPTPALDQLAKQGTRFTQFYNCAVCVTTRAGLLTGLYPRQGGGSNRLLRPEMITLGEALQQNGYQTALVGKWHLGSREPKRPIDRGFSEFYGLLSGCCNYFNPAQPDPKFYNGGNHRPFFHNETRLLEFPENFYTTDAFAEAAEQNIRRMAAKPDPFFLHVCFTAPHFPLHAPEADIARHRDRYKMSYQELREARHARQLELGIVDKQWPLSPMDNKLGDWRYDLDITEWQRTTDPARERRRMEVYAAMVDRLDQAVGRILKALDESGEADNTLVMFLSDNGGCATLADDRDGLKAYNQELPGSRQTYDFCGPGWGWAQCTPFRRYKVWTYEGGIATPLIARWPGEIKAGGLNHQVGHVIDMMPTLLELVGGKYPAERAGHALPPAEGMSLLPALRGAEPVERTLYWALFGNRAIRQGDWKLVWGRTGEQWELYNMATDRTETKNVAAEHPQRVAELKQRWNEWAKTAEVPGD